MNDRTTVRRVLDTAFAEGRTALLPQEAREIVAAYGIATPGEELATSAVDAVAAAERIGSPVVLKVVSPDISHKSEAHGVIAGVSGARAVAEAYEQILRNAKEYRADAVVTGVLVQQLVSGVDAVELIVGATTDPAFGPVVAFGAGGVLVEVLGDVTFRLAPVSAAEALSMVDATAAGRLLDGVRGRAAVGKDGVAAVIARVSELAADFPEITEIDLNPVLASPRGVTAVDVRLVVDAAPPPRVASPAREDILASMNRIMHPRAIAVIGASAEAGKIGNSVLRNLLDGGYQGTIYPINPKACEVLGLPAYAGIGEVPGPVDVAVFAIPAPRVPAALEAAAAAGIAGAIMIPSGFAETGEVELQERIVAIARASGVRILGPNIYGYYYTPEKLCATFCTPYDVAGKVALTSQSGGIGMAILGFSRATKMGVSAIVGVGNKADIDEDDLLTFFEEDPNTELVAMHFEDLKDGRAFADAARRISRHKPVVVLKAGRTAAGARAARSHTAALAGDDRIYDDILRQCGVVRAPGLRDMLEYARALPLLPTPAGDNVVIITGAGGSGVLLSDACVAEGLSLMDIPPDLDESFRAFIPPFGAAGNPIDITGGEPPSTYEATIRLGLEDPRIHALVLGYWHTIVTPPRVFAELVAEVVAEYRERGIHKPVVASLSGDVEVEAASAYLFEHGVAAYPYTTELPVAVLGAKYRWARHAGLI